MNTSEMEACKDLMRYHGYNGYPTVLHTLNIKKLHADTCKRKGVTTPLKSSSPYLKAVLWSLFIHSKLDNKDKKSMVSAMSYSEIEEETEISKRQVLDIIKDAIFMDLIEFFGQSYDKSKRYKLLFATWSTSQIDYILCKEKLKVDGNTQNQAAEVPKSELPCLPSELPCLPSELPCLPSELPCLPSELPCLHRQDIYNLNNTNIITKKYIKNIPYIFNFFEFSKSQAKIFIETLVKQNLEKESPATSAFFRPFAGVSRDHHIFDSRSPGWFILEKYDERFVQVPYKSILRILERETGNLDPETKWLDSKTPSVKLSGVYADMCLIASGGFERFDKDLWRVFMSKLDNFSNRETRLLDACYVIIYYACVSSFFEVNMDLPVLIDNMLEIHRGLKEREYEINLGEVVEYLANPVVL